VNSVRQDWIGSTFVIGRRIRRPNPTCPRFGHVPDGWILLERLSSHFSSFEWARATGCAFLRKHGIPPSRRNECQGGRWRGVPLRVVASRQALPLLLLPVQRYGSTWNGWLLYASWRYV